MGCPSGFLSGNFLFGGDPRKGTGELFWFLLISHLNNTLGNQ